MSLESFDQCVRDMRNGVLPTAQEVACPDCGGMAHLHAGMASNEPVTKLWVQGWCEDCGLNEKMDGVSPWPGWERLTVSDALRFTPAENAERIRRIVGKGRLLHAVRIYRAVYGVGLPEAHSAIQAMVQKGQKVG